MLFRSLDLAGHPIVISSSHLVAKGVLTGPEQFHLSYVHTPVRYAWDQMHAYLARSAVARSPLGPLVRLQLHQLRQWDCLSAQRVDVLVANSLASIFSSNAFLTVVPPFGITPQPTNQIANIGNNVTLNVGATGVGPFSFQWQLNGTPLNGATTPVLNLNTVRLTDAGNYSCLVTTPLGSLTSSNALLTVFSPFSFRLMVNTGLVSMETAIYAASNPEELERSLRIE